MRYRVALALLVATCAARFVSSTSMDDRVNKKTETKPETETETETETKTKTEEEDVNGDDSIQEERAPSWGILKAKLPAAVKNERDVTASALKAIATNTDEAGAGLKNAANKVDDMGDDALKLTKVGDDAAVVAKKPWSKKKKVFVTLVAAATIAGTIMFFMNMRRGPTVATTGGQFAVMDSSSGPAMDSSSGSAMDSSSGSAMDSSSGSAMGSFSGLALDSLSDSMLDEMAATGFGGA